VRRRDRALPRVTARRLKFSLDEFSEAALAVSAEVPISSTCTVFAESEIISLIASGKPIEEIVRGLHRALIKRVVSMARGVGASPPVLISGGVARAGRCASCSPRSSGPR